VCGLALDYCVQSTVFDAKKNGFETYLVLDCTKGINQEKCANILEEMKEKGIHVLETYNKN
jgi:nicotinamidase/pyrazinamidase